MGKCISIREVPVDALDEIKSVWGDWQERYYPQLVYIDRQRFQVHRKVHITYQYHLYTIYRGDDIVGILPCWCIPGDRILFVPHGGAMFPSSCIDDVAKLLFQDKRYIHAIHFRLAPYEYLISYSGHFKTCYNRYIHWTTRVPEEMEQFYSKLSKKHRRNLKTYLKRWRNNSECEIRVCESKSQLEGMLADAYAVSQNTYQYALGNGLKDIEKFRILFYDAWEAGWLDFNVAYFQERPIGFLASYRYRQTYHMGVMGYDPEVARMQVGTVMFLDKLEQLCGSEIRWIDYGFGDDFFKHSYGDESRRVVSFRVYAPRPLAIGACLVNQAVHHSLLAARQLAVKMNLMPKLKRYKRKHPHKEYRH